MKRDDDDTLALLIQKLRWLKLPGMPQLVPDLLAQAARENLTTLEVLDRLADEERRSRLERAVDRRIQDAHHALELAAQQPVEEFDEPADDSDAAELLLD